MSLMMVLPSYAITHSAGDMCCSDGRAKLRQRVFGALYTTGASSLSLFVNNRRLFFVGIHFGEHARASHLRTSKSPLVLVPVMPDNRAQLITTTDAVLIPIRKGNNRQRVCAKV